MNGMNIFFCDLALSPDPAPARGSGEHAEAA